MEKKKMDFDIVTTRNGDNGTTRLFNGQHVKKTDLIFEVLGTLDELNSHLGKVRSLDRKSDLAIKKLQRLIIRICSVIANPDSWQNPEICENPFETDLKEIEQKMQEMLNQTNIEPQFILPGESAISAETDIARTVCRRAERILNKYLEEKKIKLNIIKKIVNRTSDFLFILARQQDQKK